MKFNVLRLSDFKTIVQEKTSQLSNSVNYLSKQNTGLFAELRKLSVENQRLREDLASTNKRVKSLENFIPEFEKLKN